MAGFCTLLSRATQVNFYEMMILYLLLGLNFSREFIQWTQSENFEEDTDIYKKIYVDMFFKEIVLIIIVLWPLVFAKNGGRPWR
jgi:hypothetical protein